MHEKLISDNVIISVYLVYNFIASDQGAKQPCSTTIVVSNRAATYRGPSYEPNHITFIIDSVIILLIRKAVVTPIASLLSYQKGRTPFRDMRKTSS